MSGLMRNPLILGLMLLLAVGVGFAAWRTQGSTEAPKPTATTAPSPYAAAANGKVDVEGGIIPVAARRAGIIREVLVNEGDAVARGQILARQEDEEPRLAANRASAALGEARARLVGLEVAVSTARRERERLRALAESNFLAAQKLDQADDQVRQSGAELALGQATVDTARAALAQAQYELELTLVRAPVEGRIARRYANPGAGASTLNVSTLFDLEPKAPRIVRAEVTEGSLPAVAVGQAVEISPEAEPGKRYRGEVLRVSAVFGARRLQSDDPAERKDERVVEVVVSAGEAPLLIGQRVLVRFRKGGA
ncbi:MAG: HlyD family secretion protein [Phenylobacterium sp.]